MPKKLYFYLFVIVFLAVTVILWPKKPLNAPESKIKNFEDCVAAGNSVMESYPEQCSTPDGKVFVKQTIKEK